MNLFLIYLDYAYFNLFKRKIYRKEEQVLKDSRITCASDEIFVRSYESLLPASDGNHADPYIIFRLANFLNHCYCQSL